MKCDIVHSRDNKFRCRVCKTIISSEDWNNKNIPECSGPSLLTKLGNASTSLVTNSMNGMKQVSAIKKEERMSICRSCECFKDNGQLSTCSDCGCFLLMKTALQAEECPRKKWLKELEESKTCSSCGQKPNNGV